MTFKLWCWRRLLRLPWTARRSNQSILKEINPEYSLEGLILKLWPLDAKSQLIGKDPDAGKDWRQEENGVTEDEMVEWHYWLSGHASEQAPGDGEGQWSLVCCGPWGCRVRHDWATEQQMVQNDVWPHNFFTVIYETQNGQCSHFWKENLLLKVYTKCKWAAVGTELSSSWFWIPLFC